MDTYWVPGANHRGDWERWAFVELTDVWSMEIDLASKVEQHFNEMIDRVTAGVGALSSSEPERQLASGRLSGGEE